MISRAKERSLEPVTLGWVVKMGYVDVSGKRRDRTISNLFLSAAAAETFKDLARKSYKPTTAETGVEFYVTTKDGQENLPL